MRYRVDQFAFISSASLLKIATFATVAFALMTLLTWDGLRELTLMVGALIVGGLFAMATWYWFQERYPTATLFAERPLEPSTPFHGYIETDERNVEGGFVRVQVLTSVGPRSASISLFKQKLSHEQIRKSDAGMVRIPLSFPPLGPVGKGAFVKVRTPWFPFGWGATFAVPPQESAARRAS
jgi:hypothetical protein